MPKFEVHIPPSDGRGFDVTLKVGADNWMSALKAGMQKLGEQGTISQNVMVDIQADNSIHVTEAASGRVFRIKELSEEEAARAQVKRPSQIRREQKTEPAVKAVSKAEAKTLVPGPGADDATLVPGRAPASAKDTKGSMAQTLIAPRPQSQPPRRTNKPSTRIELKDVEELVQPINPAPANIGRARSSPAIAQVNRQQTEEILSDIFLRVVDLGAKPNVEEAMDFVLDLILEKVPCESGSVLRADLATGDLTFVVARGPKANDLLKANIVIPAGTGIAGFCATEGVSVAINDAEKDPRFYAEVGERVGYETRSMLCAPMMTHGHSFGCVQIINRKGGPQFLEHEVGVIAYLAHQAALFLNQKLLA